MKKLADRIPVPAAFFVMLAAGLVFLAWWTLRKEGLMIDEVWTFLLANGRMGLELPDAWYGTWMSGRTIDSVLRVQPTEVWDWAAPYVNQVSDVHPPLYYFGVRLVSTFFPQADLLQLGVGLNFFWQAVTLAFLFFCARRVLGGPWRALAVCAAYAFSAASVGTVLMIRMYAQLAAACGLFLWAGLRVLEHREHLRRSDLAWVFFALFFGMGTQYYFVLFAFFGSAFLFLRLCALRLWKSAFSYAAAAFGGLIAFLAFFPAFFRHVFFSYRGQEAVGNLEGSDVLGRAAAFGGIVWEHLFASPVLPWLVGAAAVCAALAWLFGRRSAEEPVPQRGWEALFVACAALPSFALVAKISAYEQFRYVSFAFPALVLLWGWCVFRAGERLPRGGSCAAVLLLAPMLFSSIGYRNDLFLLPGAQAASEAASRADVMIVDRVGAAFYTPIQTLPLAARAGSVYFVPDSNRIDYPLLLSEALSRGSVVSIVMTGNDTQLVSYLMSPRFARTHDVTLALGLPASPVWLVKEKDGRPFPQEGTDPVLALPCAR